jgi:hypothetical protein
MGTPTVTVDFQLQPDTEHTYGLLEELTPAEQVAVGQLVLATDGEVTHWARVDEIDSAHGSLLLQVLWDEPVPVVQA